MSSIGSDESAEARDRELAECREKIEASRMATAKSNKTGIHKDYVLNPSEKKHSDKIKYFERMKDKFKNEFRKNQEKFDDTLKIRWTPKPVLRTNTNIGLEWDTLLDKHIKDKELAPKKKKKAKNKTAKALTDYLEEKFHGLTFIDSQFHLYGYMKNNVDSKCYLWQGRADAIALKDGKYVIVDWKVVSKIEEYWEKDANAFGKHLHQCLVYSRLLQLHLELDYLPQILIVPIQGKRFRPGLFKDYPQQCKDKVDSFTWSIDLMQETSRQINLNNTIFNQNLRAEEVTDDKLLTELFEESAKLKNLIETFKLPELNFIKEGEDGDCRRVRHQEVITL